MRSRLSKTNAKSLATLRQRIRKYNRDFETEVKEYRDNPWESGPELVGEMEAPEPESDDDMADVGFTPNEVISMKKGKGAPADEESSESGWSESSESSTASSVEVKHEEGGRLVLKNIAQYFLKKLECF